MINAEGEVRELRLTAWNPVAHSIRILFNWLHK
jgi:hypothetical protein